VIPTKTSRAVTQFFCLGLFIVMILDHVAEIKLSKVLVRVILLAVSLSHCSLLFMFDRHRLSTFSFVNMVPFIVVSQRRAQIRCADSEIRMRNSLDVPFVDSDRRWCSCSC